MLAGSQLVSLLALVAVAAAQPALLGPTALDGVLAGFPLGVLAAIAYLAYFTALRIGPLSIVSPVVVAYGGVTVVLAIAAARRGPRGATGVGVLLVTAGVVLAAVVIGSADGSRVRLAGLGIAAAVVALLGFAVLTLGLADPIRAHGWLPVIIGIADRQRPGVRSRSWWWRCDPGPAGWRRCWRPRSPWTRGVTCDGDRRRGVRRRWRSWRMRSASGWRPSG